MKITRRGTTIYVYEIAAKQPKKKSKLWVKNFPEKLNAEKGWAWEKYRNKEEMKIQQNYTAAEKSW